MVKRTKRSEEQLRKLAEVQRLFNDQVSPLYDKLFRTALASANYNYEEAQDLQQRALTRAYKSFDKFEQGTNLLAWLSYVLKNVRINEVRARGMGNGAVLAKAVRLDKEDEEGLNPWRNSLELSVGPMGPDEYLPTELSAALRAIPLIFRAPFVLAVIEEIPYWECCEILGIPNGTMKSRLYRAREMLTERLADYAKAHGYERPKRRLAARHRSEYRRQDPIEQAKSEERRKKLLKSRKGSAAENVA